MKKQLLIPLCTVGSLIAIGGIVFGISKYRDSRTVIEVTPVEYISTYYYEDNSSSEGVITSNMSQEIYLDANQLVKEVYVSEGDQVKIGDKILEYDTTLTEIDRRGKEIEISKLEQQIKDLNRQIANIRNGNFSAISQSTMIQPVYLASDTPSTNAVIAANVINHTTEGTDETPETPPESESAPQESESAPQESESTPQESESTPQESESTPQESEPTPPEPEPTPSDPEGSDLPDPVEKLDYDTEILSISDGKFPIVYCTSSTIITREFLYLIYGLDKEGKPFEEEQDISEHEPLEFLFIMQTDQNKKTTLLILDQLILPEEGIEECTIEDFIKTYVEPEEEPVPEDPEFGNIDDIYVPTYTWEEINQMVTERQLNIAQLLTSKKQAELDILKLNKTLKNAIVTSTVNGIVKKAGNQEEGAEEGSAFVVIDSQEGLYLSSTINELQLGKINVGDTIHISSWMTGTSCDATITEISDYPTNNNFGYSPNPNVSFYPIKAYIDEDAEFSNNEWVQVTLSENADTAEDTLYIHNAYVLEEHNRSYVYIRDENELLKKQEITTGQIIYGSYLEIKTGLSRSDYIAFPYGKGIKDGVKTKEASDIYY